MKRVKFRVGDRVRTLKKVGMGRAIGVVGTIRAITAGPIPIGVEFDSKIRGHSLAVKGVIYSEKSDGWWLKEEDLEHIHELDIILGV